ncbi:bifunctional diaminohydroxyphosphoribosylaminopyrimidine deaminase/5-amino-6-(5-phosphoribosylamino)uracil reductase RibD [Motiliproteus sp. SC1-56]|uniref:bifunctional diaminohydroxyphosphoribosylaminopyrimidine deaminase/5-amino-6-(5-phosphoribosylamino)uracil reductase RibD n=1 Tax=Motiliproteus sp. SC1-56 TaxID=2799565 RepID=UPI001A900B5C|nr:bifunctional diaminohydroxyphosphoribosylaminopyrimidine deaminase/5-amino-6-(5-phosphoribosylamino)uracil reductase RibD [Motiliproteus sp. SC1-56]
MFSADDHRHMARALQLARRGLYTTEPNPRVGCVLVRDGVVVGEGFHVRAGEGHAEVNALAVAGDRARGATAYVTLEPCSHQGRTGPCAEALVKAGVARVVSAMEDPNPRVAGRGHRILEAAGIDTACGLLTSEARALNPGFIARMTRGRPFVRIKQAMSLDGRTAMASGESQWITGPCARSAVQRLRARSSAVLTGVGTVIHDDPALTLRAEQLGLPAAEAEAALRRQPLRVILDTGLRTPPESAILKQPGETLIVHRCDEPARAERLTAAGASLLAMDPHDPASLLQWLAAERECNELLVEAGAVLAGSLMRAGLVDELVVFVAPKLLGSEARPLLQLPGMARMDQQIPLTLSDLRRLGEDLCLTYRVEGAS